MRAIGCRTRGCSRLRRPRVLAVLVTAVAALALAPASALGASVASPSLSRSSSAAGASSVTYTVGFTTSATGAIPAGGTITLAAPAGTLWPTHDNQAYVLTDSTTPSGSFTAAQGASYAEPDLPIFGFEGYSGAVVTIAVPNAINAGDHLSLVITGVSNPGVGSGRLTVSTSADAVPVSMLDTITTDRSVSTPTLSVSVAAAAATDATYTVGFTTSATGAIPAGGTITLAASPGTLWPTHNNQAYTLTDSTTPSGSFTAAQGTSYGEPGLPIFGFEGYSGAQVTINVPNAINAGDHLSLAITGVSNPGAGSGRLSVSTSSDPTPASTTDAIASAGSVSTPSVSPSSTTAGGTGVTYTIGFSSSADGAIAAGGTVTLIAPPGTELPGSQCDYALTDSTTSGGDFGCASSVTTGASGSIATLTVPNAINAGDDLRFAVSGVTNPGAGIDTLKVATSSDRIPATSSSYALTGSSSPITRVSATSLSTSSSTASANGVTYTVKFTAGASGGLTGGTGAITLAAPAGTIFGPCSYGCGGGNAVYTIDDLTTPSGSGSASPSSLSDDYSTVDIVPANTIKGGDQIVLTMTQVTNPPAGAGQLKISTSSDTEPVKVSDTTIADVVADSSLAVDPASGGESATYTVGFNAGPSGQLLGGLSAITLTAAPGTVFSPSATITIDDLTTPSGSASTTADSILGNGAIATFPVPNTIAAGDEIRLSVDDVTNPPSGARVPVAVSTSSDPSATTSALPTGVTATAGNVSAQVSWTVPAATTSPITGWVVTPYAGSVAQPPFVSDSSADSATVAGLQNGTAYTFKVAAVDADGTGPQSGSSSPVTPEPPAGGTPAGTGFTTASLDFGTIAVGHVSSAETVGLSNTGGTPLQVSAVTVGAADAADFTLTTDTCSGATIASAQSCTVTVTFAPTAAGARTAQLAFADSALGSPQTVTLTGTGTDLGSLSGTIVNGTSSNRQPVSGAGISICPQAGSNITGSCQSITSTANGEYEFAGLQAGPWLIQVSPPSPRLFGASAIVQVQPGSQTHDFTLNAPAPLPSRVTIDGPSGVTHGGIPTLNWSEPFSMQFGPQFPSEPAGTQIAYFVTVAMYNAGNGNANVSASEVHNANASVSASRARSSSSSASAINSGTLALLVSYGPGGNPSVIGEYPDPGSGPDPTITFEDDGQAVHALARESARVHTAGASGLPGILVGYLPSSNVIEADVPSPQEKTHGATSIGIDGSYAVVGDGPAANSTAAVAGSAPARTATAGCVVPRLIDDPLATAKRALTAAGCTVGATVTGYSTKIPAGDVASSSPAAGTIHAAGTKVKLGISLGPKPKAKECKVPKVIGDTLAAADAALGAAGCGVGAVSPEYTTKVPAGRIASSSPRAGTTHPFGTKVKLGIGLGPKPKRAVKFEVKDGVIKVKSHMHGPIIHIHFPCEDDDCDVYYDPSGTVLSRTGIPLASATVVLLRSSTSAGPFVHVPNGSVIMSPGNRRNPDRTSALGDFGWDVSPGYYRVSAHHPGCSAGHHRAAAVTRVHSVPPPVSNVLIKLTCPHLKRSRTHVSLRIQRSRGSILTVTATVHGRKPVGFVVLTAGSLTTTLPINSRTHRATIALSPGARRVRAHYEGDAHNQPSSGSAQAR